jgi:hypothetical protein
MPDTDAALLDKLERVFLKFGRRALCLHERSPRVLVTSELGLMPLKTRRFVLLLRLLAYLIALPEARLVHKALLVSEALRIGGFSSWMGDVHVVYHSFCPEKEFPSLVDLNTERIVQIIKEVVRRCQ